MSRSRRPFRSFAAAASLAVAAPLLGAGGVAGAAPADVARQGPPPAVPYVVGSTLRDGSNRVALDFERSYELRRVPGGWLVRGRQDNLTTLAFVTVDGPRTTLGGAVAQWEASEDGARVAWVRYQRSGGTSVVVDDTDLSGERRRRGFSDATVLAVETDRVLVASGDRGSRQVAWWDTSDGTVTTVTTGRGVAADVEADRLVLNRGGDPCNQSVVALSSPTTEIADLGRLGSPSWAPGGRSVLLDECTFDQPHDRRVVVRSDPSYDTTATTRTRRTGDIGLLQPTWESARQWLLVRYDEHRVVVERCNLRKTSCEQAGRSYRSRLDPSEGTTLRRPALVLGS